MAIALQKEDRTSELLVRLKAGVTDLVASDRWKQYLRVQAQFHSYSASNVMLIMMQYPNASRVAGFQRWKDFGRYVRRGEHGIGIFAPITRKIAAVDSDGEETSFSQLVGFKVAYVFDVSQTDGKPMPEHPARLLDTKGSDATMQTMLKAAQKLGVSVEFGSAGGPNGYYNPQMNQIMVENSNPPAQQLKTLIHELVHATLHAKWEPDVSRNQKEIEAESAAYIVCQHVGLDSADYSLAYVAGWSGSDPELILRYSERIRKAADRIIGLVEAVMH